jgi:hypothetical protein
LHFQNRFLKDDSNQKWFMRSRSIEDIAYFQRNICETLYKDDCLQGENKIIHSGNRCNPI